MSNRSRAGFLAIALTVVTLGGSPASEFAPLQAPDCELSPELKAVTGHVLFRYQVSSEGAVEAIWELYGSAEPESYREDFIAHLRGCLESWRYTPATLGKIPVPVQMLMAFHYFEPEPHGAPAIDTPEGRSIPLRHFHIMRDEKLALASRLLEGPDYAEIAGKGWLVRTDVAADQRADLIAAIERAARVFDQAFPGAPEPTDASSLTVLLFRTKDEFNQVAAFDNILRMRGFLAGQYSPQELTAYSSLGDQPVELAIAVLVHEATHHLVHQRLFQDGRPPPYWVNEGIATFVQLVRDMENLNLSHFDRGQHRSGDYRWLGQGEHYLQVITRGQKSMPDLGAFLSQSPDLGPIDTDISYGLSWLIVHYLITGDQGAHREKFESWLLTDARAGDGDSLLRALGTSEDALQGALEKHRKKMRSSY